MQKQVRLTNVLFIFSYVSFIPNLDCICQESAFSKITLTKVNLSLKLVLYGVSRGNLCTQVNDL